jgi:hypothetical protein
MMTEIFPLGATWDSDDDTDADDTSSVVPDLRVLFTEKTCILDADLPVLPTGNLPIASTILPRFSKLTVPLVPDVLIQQAEQIKQIEQMKKEATCRINHNYDTYLTLTRLWKDLTDITNKLDIVDSQLTAKLNLVKSQINAPTDTKTDFIDIRRAILKAMIALCNVNSAFNENFFPKSKEEKLQDILNNLAAFEGKSVTYRE